MISAPLAPAASIAAAAVVPQSTVKISFAPFSASPASAAARRAIALGQTVGDVGCHALAVGAQESLDQRHRGRAVNVVVAEHGDGLARFGSLGRSAPPRAPCPASLKDRARDGGATDRDSGRASPPQRPARRADGQAARAAHWPARWPAPPRRGRAQDARPSASPARNAPRRGTQAKPRPAPFYD